MTEQMQEAKATPAAQKAKAKSHPSNTIQTSSEIISVDEPENALPEVSLADLPQLLQTACAKAGWNSLMPVQSRALPYLLEGRDLMVQSRTGSGKTGTYLLPLMARLNPAMPAVQALILVPTRELAVQVEQEAKTAFQRERLYRGRRLWRSRLRQADGRAPSGGQRCCGDASVCLPSPAAHAQP